MNYLYIFLISFVVVTGGFYLLSLKLPDEKPKHLLIKILIFSTAVSAILVVMLLLIEVEESNVLISAIVFGSMGMLEENILGPIIFNDKTEENKTLRIATVVVINVILFVITEFVIFA